MCGIAGAIGIADESVMKSMLDMIAHRGPDGHGMELYLGSDQPPVMLGHRRLSIIDLSANGRQPMSNEDGTIWVTYNGEIYNFLALRKELIEKGHKFQSLTDTEVLVHGWEEWGRSLFEKLVGMFAFAIFNSVSRELVLVRDRLGIKPLYYTSVNNSFVFSSEVKAFMEVPGFTASISNEALEDYLSLGYVAGEITMFEGVLKLPPGSTLTLSDGGMPVIESYWQLPCPTVNTASKQQQEGEFHDLLTTAVTDRLVSDVPLGSFLSGGVDSGVVSAMMGKTRQQDLQTFCVGYTRSESRHDERPYAEEVAKHIGSQHRGYECSDEYAISNLARLIWHLDEPIAEQLLAPYAKLCESARDDVTVVLSGEGADEFLYGYRYYCLEKIRFGMMFIPRSLREFTLRAIDKLGNRDNLRTRAVRSCLQSSELESTLEWSTLFPTSEKDTLLGRPAEKSRIMDLFGNFLGQRSIRGIEVAPALDSRFRMVDYILTRTDKLSMAVGLEVRVPFLDHRVVEYLSQVPVSHKIRGFEGKQLLRAVAGDLLPPSSTQRRKKPFGAPVADWMVALDSEYLSQSRLIEDGVITEEGVTKLRLSPRTQGVEEKLWSIIVLEIWYRLFIRKDMTP